MQTRTSKGTVEIDLVNNTIIDIPTKIDGDLDITYTPGIEPYLQIEELNLITGAATGKIYKSTDEDLTIYNQFINVFGGYEDCMTMKCISSISELKKEYAPNHTYLQTTGTSSVKGNPMKTLLLINNKEYLVPWYAAFNNSENELEVEIVLETNHKANGEIRIVALKEEESNISISGDKAIPITASNAGTTINKKIKIKFNKPIDNDSVLEARFFEEEYKNDNAYPGNIVGLLNIYKNNIEYKLKAKYVDLKFKGKIREIPSAQKSAGNNHNLETFIDFGKNFFNYTDTITKQVYPDISFDLSNHDLQKYLQSNSDFFKNTFGQALIKYDLITPTVNLEIDFGNYNFKHPPGIISKGIDRIKKSLMSFYGQDGFRLILKGEKDIDEFIKGIIEAYETLNGNNDRGVVIFLLPFTLLQFVNAQDLTYFKGKVVSDTANIRYVDKYVILTRSLLEQNIREALIHESAHSLGVNHPFEGFTIPIKHHFIKSGTENVMDYPEGTMDMNYLQGVASGNTPVATKSANFGIYFYKWQWETMQGDIRTESQQGDLLQIDATNGSEIL